MQPQSQKFSCQQLTLTLQDIQEIDNLYPQNLISTNPFAVYQSSSDQILQTQIPLIALDTHRIPKIPMRRINCVDCLNQNLSCSKCDKCRKNKCCRNLRCFYDFQEWKKNRDNQRYRTCECNEYSFNSDKFSIDWRLQSIIEKIPDQIIEKQVPMYLSKARNCLWINYFQTQENSSKINHIYYQDNFSPNSFFQKSIKSSNPTSIKAIVNNNSRQLQNIFKKNIKNYLSRKQNWDLSNIEKQCQEIFDEFIKDKKIKKVTNELFKNSQIQVMYSNMPSLKYQGKYMENISNDKYKVQYGQRYSKYNNENILFYFCRNTTVLFIKNAKFYPQDNQYSNLRPIEVQFIRKQKMNFSRFYWFKDKIGDIFAIYEDSLYIFKYDLQKKYYVMIILHSHRCFSQVDSSNSILYVGQKDFVYYFNSMNLKKSFYFALSRPKIYDKQSKQTSKSLRTSCNNVSIYEAAFEKISCSIATNNIKSTYIIEDIIYKKGNKQFRQQIPIIYIFFQRRNYEPYGICVMSITHVDSIQCKEIVTNDIENRKDNFNNINLNVGFLFTVRREKCPCFYFYTLNENSKVLIGVKIQYKNQKSSLKWWQQASNLQISNDPKLNLKKTSSNEQKNYYLPYSYVATSSLIPQNQRSSNEFYIQFNDISGLPSNNDFRLLVLNTRTNKISQVAINFIEGDPQWQFDDQP